MGELFGALTWLGLHPSVDDIVQFMDSYDADMDGVISYGEFLQAVNTLAGLTPDMIPVGAASPSKAAKPKAVRAPAVHQFVDKETEDRLTEAREEFLKLKQARVQQQRRDLEERENLTQAVIEEEVPPAPQGIA